MASTRQGGGAWLLLCVTVALMTMAQAQQATVFPGFPSYSIGQCPKYQTSGDFSQEFIDQLTTLPDGYILVLSDGSADACQKLKFLDEDTFKYSFSDIFNRSRIHSSTYTATPANLTAPAQIKLDMVIGMLGADFFGRLTLIPVAVDANKLVLASCTQLGAIKSEQLLVFVPYPSTANATAIKEELIASGIPNAERLAEINQKCVPGSRRAPPIPVGFNNLISALNPARQTQNSAGAIRRPGVFARDRVTQGSLRSGLIVDETENALPQPADNSVPFYTGNFEVPVFYNFQQPLISTFASGYPAEVPYNAPQAPGVTYTAAAHGVTGSSYYPGKVTYNAPQAPGVTYTAAAHGVAGSSYYPGTVTYTAPQAPGVTYTAAAHGVAGSSYYPSKFPNEIYTQFYAQGK